MSWLNNLSDLAGKAENLLNNIDQSAAVAISKATDKNEFNAQPIAIPDASRSATGPSKDETAPKQATVTESAKTTNVKLPSKKREITRVKDTKDTTSDDALFKFLNSDKKVTKARAPPMVPANKKTPAKPPSGTGSISSSPMKPSGDKKDQQGPSPVPTSLEISRSSSFDSDHSKLSTRVPADNGSSSSEPHETISEADVMTLPTDSTASESEFEMVGSTAAASSDRDTPESGEAVLPSVSSKRDLAVENRLLKNEMSSLHQELTHMNARNIKIKTDLQSSNSELQSRCDDLNEELKVKSSQLVALQMKLRESENLLIMEQENSEKMQSNLDRLRLDQSEGSEMHGRAIDELRSRLEETEHTLAMERRAHSEARQEILQNKARQDLEAKKIAESYQKSERDRQFEKKKLDELMSENRTLKASLTSSKQELVDYKQKAARILQSKERLITSLKGTGEVEMTSSTIASLELEELKQERDVAREEATSLRIDIQNIRAEFQDTEQQYQQENASLAQEVNELRSRLDEDQRSHREVQSELARLQEEMRQDREEATRSRSSMQARIKDKEMDIDRLRNQLMIKSQSSPQESELESRLRQLTETVIQKQAIIETLSAEKNSLLVQMERMEGQIKTLRSEGSHVRLNVDAEHTNPQNGGSSYIPEFSYGGSEQGVVGKVRKAASALDRFSIRLGVFLKRYPPARLFLLFYMGLLHIWVMIVLLTYTPEVHGQDFVGPRRTDLMVGC